MTSRSEEDISIMVPPPRESDDAEGFGELLHWAEGIRELVWPLLKGPDRGLAMAAFLVGLTQRGAVGRTDGEESSAFARMVYAEHLVDVHLGLGATVTHADGSAAPAIPIERLPRPVLMDAAQAAAALDYGYTLQLLAAAAERAPEVC